MTKIISAPTESGQIRHYFVRGSTLDGWRPQPGEWARLVKVLPWEKPGHQAVVGDVVRVTRCSTGPGWERYGLHLEHEGGSNHRCATLDTPPGERLNLGTFGHWEHLIPIVLKTSEGSTLDKLSSEDRVAVLVAAVAELTAEERVAAWEALAPEAFRRLDAIQVQEKARADRAEQRVRELEGVLGITQASPQSPTAEELRLWNSNMKIDALRSYRTRNGLDLVAAKRLFEGCAAALEKEPK